MIHLNESVFRRKTHSIRENVLSKHCCMRARQRERDKKIKRERVKNERETKLLTAKWQGA